MQKNKKGQSEIVTIILIFLVIIVILGLIFIGPMYNVWSQEKPGQAELARAEWNRQIAVQEAEANLEAEKLNAQAEVERAKGVAEANRIIGEGLKNNSEYIHYLWVKGLTDGSSEVIYVPTEANIPIMEATRLTQK